MKLDLDHGEHTIRLGIGDVEAQRTNDRRIDFLGTNFKIVPLAVAVAASCKADVVGQAKRYKAENVINEGRLPEFVGAATLRRY